VYQSSVDDHIREINGRRYVKSRGRLLELGEPKPADQPVGGLGIFTVVDGVATPFVCDHSVDPDAAVQRLIASTGAIEFDQFEPDAMRDEINRLTASGFVAVAASAATATGYREPEPLGPLDLGRVMIDTRAIGLVPFTHVVRGNVHLSPEVMAFTPEDVRGLLKRHANGDHGDFGKAADATVTDDMRWAPEVFPWPQRNAVAIETGRGLVRSAYGVDILPKARLDPRFDGSWIVRPQLVHLDVVTLIGRYTIVWPRSSGVGF
jgi:hypothetical protein